MVELTITDVSKLEDNDIRTMSGTIKLSSVVTMAAFIKKVKAVKKNYTADYAEFIVTF